MRRWLRIASFVGAAFVALLVVAVVATQTAWFKDWLRRYVEREAADYLNGKLAIQRLDGNLFTGIEIQGLTLTQGTTTILAARDVGVRYSLWDVIRGDLVIDQIRIDEPRIALRRGPEGWNLAGLVKEQRQEADREGPARPVTIGEIGISNGTVTIDEPEGPGASGLPKRIERVDLQGAFSYKPVDFTITVGHLSFRTTSPDVALNSLSGVLRVNDDDVQVERLAVRTAESSLSAKGYVRDYLKTPILDLAISSDKLTPREFAGIVPALADVRVQPAFELTARGPLANVAADLAIRSDAGTVNASLVADAQLPGRRLRGDAAVTELDVSRVVATLPASRVNARAQVDVALDDADPTAIDGRAYVKAAPTVYDGYRLDALEARATFTDGRMNVDANARAYGTRATASGTVAPPRNGRPLTAALEGRVADLDLRRLPRSLRVPRLDTDATASYELRLDGRATSVALTFDPSTVEGATIAAGTYVSATLAGTQPTFAARGAIEGVDPQRFGAVLQVPALREDRMRGRVDATFDVAGRGRTLATLELRGQVGVPQAAIAGGELRDVVVDATLTRGAVDGTIRGSFTDVDPGLAAGRPALAGAVTGTLDAAFAAPSVTSPSLPDASGRAQVTLAPSRIGDQRIDRAQLSATLARGVLDVASLEAAGPLADVQASGPVALTREDASNLQYRVVVSDLAPAAALAGQEAIRGAGQVEGTLTGNLAELETSGTLSLSNAAYGTTARALDTDVRYDVTLPELDAQRARVDADVRAAMVEISGQTLSEATATVRYADRTAAFDARLADTQARRLEAAGAVALTQPSGADVRLDRLVAAADQVAWSLTAPARIQYAADRVDVDRLALASGSQRIEAAGAVGLGDGAARAVPQERPLTLTLADVDLVGIDRLLRSGRRLGGIVTGTATASGSLDAPTANATLAVRNGAFGDFTYQALDAKLSHDAQGARIEARLERGAEWLAARGTLPPLPVLRDEARRNTAPVDLHVESSTIDLGVVQAFTPMVEKVTGTLDAKVHLTGTLAAPTVDGGVTIANGAFTIAGEGTTFTAIQADVGLGADRVDVRRLQVADEDGHLLQVTGGAGVSFAERRVDQVNLKVTSDDFQVLDGDFGRVHLDTDLSVSGALQALRAEGTIAIGSGRVEIDRVLETVRPAKGAVVEVAPSPASVKASPGAAATAGEPASTAVATANPPAPQPPAAPSIVDAMALDLRVTVPNTLILRGDGVKVGGEGLSLGNLNITLGGDLHASKAPGASTVIVGTVNTVRGFYEFQGRRFELRRDGTVDFKGPDVTNPRLNVTATRDISGVEARVRVHGEARRPELELSSAPPLDEGDILSLIIFNRPINDLGEGEKTTLAQRAGSIVGGFVAAPVAEALRDALDVDLLEITPVSEESGATTVSVGNQIGEKVFVKVRQQFGSSEVTQLVLEYELSKVLRLETNIAQGGETSKTIGRRAERGGADLVFVVKY